MPRRRGPDPDARRRAEESEAALAAGGIPLAASERLEEFRRSGERFFTSDLSVNELVVTRDTGFRPLTQVMGTCFYRTGWQSYPWARGGGWLGGSGWGVSGAGETVELEQQTDAWNEARRLAVGRLRRGDAPRRRRRGRRRPPAPPPPRLGRGPDRVRRHRHRGALRAPRASRPPSRRCRTSAARTSPSSCATASGRSASSPATTVAYVATGGQQQMRSTGLFSSWQNQEMPDFTRGIYDARALAMTRLSQQAHALRRARRRRRDDRALAPRDRARPRRRHEVHRPHHRDARPRHRHRRGGAPRGAAARRHRPAAERPEERT